MNFNFKSFVLGVVLALIVPVGAFAALFFMERDSQPVFRVQPLPSGKVINVISFHMVWGIEHSERDTSKDSLAIEYLMPTPEMDQGAAKLEAEEVFELIRPVSEQWGFRTASVSALPTADRRNGYDVYQFTRNADDHWSNERLPFPGRKR